MSTSVDDLFPEITCIDISMDEALAEWEQYLQDVEENKTTMEVGTLYDDMDAYSDDNACYVEMHA
jgi:hypothetical protein